MAAAIAAPSAASCPCSTDTRASRSRSHLLRALERLQRGFGVDSVQYYDHNFFDRPETSLATLEVLARAQLPWWCYARADALAAFTPRMWELARQSRLRMAYIGAEAGSNEALRRLHKGTRVEQRWKSPRACAKTA